MTLGEEIEHDFSGALIVIHYSQRYEDESSCSIYETGGIRVFPGTL